MTVFNVSTAAQLQTALHAAAGGDKILLASGNYGDFVTSALNFSSNVTIASADPNQPAVFHSIYMNKVSNLAFSNLAINFTPTATSAVWNPAFEVDNSNGVSLQNSTVTGGPAINGVSPTATSLDATGNVKGFPTGLGVSLVNSTGVSISGNTMSSLDKGIELTSSTGTSITNNSIQNLRQGAIEGSNISSTTITGNHFSNSNPWAWNTSYGDHADFIHIWTNPPTQLAASANINISNNVIDQGSGAPIMGINLEAHDASGKQSQNALGFTNVQIENNAIILGNAQGLRLENVAHSTIQNNTLVEPSNGVAAPGLLFALGNSSNNVVSGNVLGAISNESASADLTNSYSGNHIAQDQSSSAANYFNVSLANQLQGSTDTASIRSAVLAALPATTTSSVYTATSANISANLAAISSNGSTTSVIVSDNAPVTVTVAQLASYGKTLMQLSNQGGGAPTLVVSDTSAALLANLGTLSANSSISKILSSDGQELWISASQAQADSSALNKLLNANGKTVLVGMKDTAANLTAAFPSLASTPHINSIVVSDSGTINLSASEFLNVQNTLKLISGRYSIALTDTGSNVAAVIDQLTASQKSSGPHYSSIIVSDSAQLSLSINQLVNDGGVLRTITNSNGSPSLVTVHDTSANIASNLDLLNRTANLTSVVSTDSQSIILSAQQATVDSKIVGQLTGSAGAALPVIVADTAANVASHLSSLATLSTLAGINITNSASIVVSQSQFNADAAVLGKVEGAHSVQVNGIAGQVYTSEIFTYGTDGHLASTTLMNTDGSQSVQSFATGATFSIGSVSETISTTVGSQTFVFGSSFGNEKIAGFQAASDVLDFSKSVFGSTGAALAAAKNDGHGDVIFQVSAHETLTLLGTSVSDLQSHIASLHVH